MAKPKKIRDIVYGFITISEQEQAIIDHPVFQRLRRIKQLALTDMAYPGASHTRFEHSIGVMQMASDMFDSITHDDNQEARAILEREFYITKDKIPTYKTIVRLAALLHDIGHAPFSHSGEEIMPILSDSEKPVKRYKHEDYSIAIIKRYFKDIIERDFITVDQVTALLGDKTVRLKNSILVWKGLISSQLDADRADYLLRDSKHLGVSYGLYDRDMLVKSMTIARNMETGDAVIAIQKKAWHLAESFVIARYQMYTQVYFHKVRRIYDYHVCCAAKEVLNSLGFGGVYPEPAEIEKYIDFDDWKMQAAIKDGHGGKHGKIILDRKHFKRDDEGDKENPSVEEFERLKARASVYRQNGVEHHLDEIADALWYKMNEDILVEENGFVQPLSKKSEIVNALKQKTKIIRLYVEHRMGDNNDDES
jgi:HD superfamily phosphohydrolase